MPEIEIRGARLFYVDEGDGDECVVFAHGLLFDRRIFDAQAAALRDRYRVVRFDFRGHGRSEVTESGYDMDGLFADTVSLIEALGAAPCHFVGLSMGGFVGLRLASRRPDLVRSLVLLDTSADPEPRKNVLRYRLLNLAARWLGIRAVVDRVLPIVFGTTFLADPEQRGARELWRERIAAQDRRGIHRAVNRVIERDGVADELPGIRVPTLILVGQEDVATAPEKSRRMHELIPRSELELVPAAGHMTSIEVPEVVTGAIGEFLAGLAERP